MQKLYRTKLQILCQRQRVDLKQHSKGHPRCPRKPHLLIHNVSRSTELVRLSGCRGENRRDDQRNKVFNDERRMRMFRRRHHDLAQGFASIKTTFTLRYGYGGHKRRVTKSNCRKDEEEASCIFNWIARA